MPSRVASRSIEYDTLVLALGSRTHFFGVPGAEEHAITLDSLQQAERLRKRLLQACLRKTAQSWTGESPVVDISIIGAGATGVELAAELRRMESTFKHFGILTKGPGAILRITLLEAGPRVLPALPQRVSDSTHTVLESMGVSVLVLKAVTGVHATKIELAGGQTLTSDVTIWAAGIKAPGVLGSLDGIAVNRINQVRVSRSLQSETDENVFALGDCASCAWTKENMVPPRAQAAHQQATFLFKALCDRIDGRPLGIFQYKDHGSLVSLGSSTVVGSVAGLSRGGKIFVKGYVAEFIYAALYRKHLMAVSGLRRAAFAIAAHTLNRMLSPRVKLH
jgi:NADH dehydrogenase